MVSWHRFSIDFGGFLGGKIEPRSKKKCPENMMQNKSRFERVLERFCVDFGPIWAPKIIPLGLSAPFRTAPFRS